MKLFIAILILAIVLIAGCSQISSIQTQQILTDFSNITKNPEIYENKTTTIQGKLKGTLVGSYFLEDSQGYRILIYGSEYTYTYSIGNCKESNRNYDIESYYKAKGFINKTTKKTYSPYGEGNETIYFFQCTEPIVKVS
jgi:hypothetical protein